MTVTLDAATEARIQQQIDRGSYRNASEVIAQALDYLSDDTSWSNAEKADLDNHLAASLAQANRGELFTGEEARRILAERRAQRPR